MASKEAEAAGLMNRWWRKRTGKDETPASPSGADDGFADVDATALSVLIVYARNMSALAESRRAKIEELTADVATLQRALLEAGRSGEP